MSRNLVISHFQEELTADEAIAVYRDLEEGYAYTISDVTIKLRDFCKFIDEIRSTICDLREYDYSRSKASIFKKFSGGHIRIYVRSAADDAIITISSIDEETNSQVWAIYKKHATEENSIEIYTHSYFMANGQLDSYVKTLDIKDLNYISELYYPYIDVDVMFNQFFTGSENILLLVGKPGIGKSKLSTLAIKHAYENIASIPYVKTRDTQDGQLPFITVVYVKSVEVLANDKFWRAMESDQIDFIIIDDLDFMLTKRDAEISSHDDMVKNSFMNQFLSFTDGVEKHKSKFIITTNQSHDDIDSALLRKGRLFDILELRNLDKNEALAVWKDNGLLKDDFEQIFKTHEILPAELGSEISKRLNKRIKNVTTPYLLEDGISKVKRTGKSKRIKL